VDSEEHRPATAAPLLRQRRDSLMPIVAAALSVRGGTHTCVGEKSGPPPPLHPLVAGFLDALPAQQRERFTGRCPEAVLLSQFFAAAEEGRSKRAARKPFTESDARKSLRGARMTTVRIREEGDPAHGTHQPPCRSCSPLLAHYGVQSVALHASASP
jgi:hypothetical protein